MADELIERNGQHPRGPLDAGRIHRHHLRRVGVGVGVGGGVGVGIRVGLGSPSWDPSGPNRFTPLVRFWTGGGANADPPPPGARFGP